MLDLNTLRKLFFPKYWIKGFSLLFFLSSLALHADDESSWSTRDKLAQLFMVPVYTQGPNTNVNEVLHFIDRDKLGGVIFMQGDISSQQKAYLQLQEKSSVPLLTAADYEWGLEMRLKDAMRFPRNLTLGAIQDNQLIYEMGLEVARQCKGVGVFINFSPVVDINNNPDNPVINDRSFGETESLVTTKGLAMLKGLQEGGVLACAKHFPGHGDTHQDSHQTLPLITKNFGQLQALELKPFKALIEQGLSAIMPAHISFNFLNPSLPSSLSDFMLQDVLVNKLHFEGLIFSDSLKMGAITELYPVGERELKALLAGNDCLVFSEDYEKALSYLEKAVLDKRLPLSLVNEKVSKILELKKKIPILSAHNFEKIDLFSDHAKKLKKTLFSKAITQVKKHKKLDPKLKTAFVQIGRDLIMKDSLKLSKLTSKEQRPKSPPDFYSELSKTLSLHYFFLPKQASEEEINTLIQNLNGYDQVVIGVYEMNKYSSLNFGIRKSTLSFLEKLPQDKYLTLFGSPYSLKFFSEEQNILMAYENDPDAQQSCAHILLGLEKAEGILPVTASEEFSQGLAVH